MDTHQEKDVHKYKILPVVVVVVSDEQKRALLLKRKREAIDASDVTI